MKKNLLAAGLACIMLVGQIIPASAAEISNPNASITLVNENDSQDENHSSITESEAIELARWFIANDIYESGNNGWSEATVIESIDFIQGYYDSSYVIKLASNGIDNGYVVVGDNASDTLIKEYAYAGEPLMVGLMPINSAQTNTQLSDVAMQLRNNTANVTDTLDLTDENMAYLSIIRDNNSDSVIKPYSYGEITSPYSDVNKKYGSGWTESSDTDTISGFTSLDMDDFTGPNHCSLTSLTAIFNYHRTHGYSNIPANTTTLFNRIKTLASVRGFYTSSNGTYPWYIDNLATIVWQEYGYSGTGNNDFFYSTLSALNNKFKTEINANRPGTISFTTGSYGDHTVTYYGYKFYEKANNTDKMYVRVNDNWTTSARYIDVTYIATHSNVIFEVCRVLP